MPKSLPSRKVRSQPLLAVGDVRASSHWYATLLGLESVAASAPSDHDDVYDRLLDGGELALQLHVWDLEDDSNVDAAERGERPGRGVLVWFEVEDFDAVVARAKKLRASVIKAPHVNPAPKHREVWLEDPNGYIVVVASPDGEAAARSKTKAAKTKAAKTKAAKTKAAKTKARPSGRR